MIDYLDKECAVFRKTRAKWGVFSNFHPTSLKTHVIWPTSEHLYQALKSKDPVVQEYIRVQSTPAAAKTVGHQVKIRNDWEEIKIDAMTCVLWIKYHQRPEFVKALIVSGDREIVEYSRYDTFWGAKPTRRHLQNGKGEILRGHNVLGRLLMRLRDTDGMVPHIKSELFIMEEKLTWNF